MTVLKFSDSDALALLDAVRHACDDLYATIQDESGVDEATAAMRQRRLDDWEKVSASLAKQMKGCF